MFWILIFLILWVTVGVAVLYLGSRPTGRDYRRSSSRRFTTEGHNVEVMLQLMPPSAPGLPENHDVVLAIDRSSSMGAGPGSPLQEAIRAADNFVRRCPQQLHIGIVAFDDQAQVRSSIGGDHRKTLLSLAGISSGGGTAIHNALDACREAIQSGRPGVKKTVILLSDGASDPAAAEKAADLLRAETSRPEIITVGFGTGVNEPLMVTIAGAEKHYCHVSKTEDLHALFTLLAAAVSGRTALCGLIDEGVEAPSPFQLATIGGLYPAGLQPGRNTRIFWSVPIMDSRPAGLTYQLIPECPGWHRLASPNSKATWQMPEGTVQEVSGPSGPRVLVLPSWFGWAWPILNPLFFMIFARYFCRHGAEPMVSAVSEVRGLPLPSLPQLPPEPQERIYRAHLKPAIVVGLGETGEWILARLKDRLRDRSIEPGLVGLLSADVIHRSNRAPVRVAGMVLDKSERIELHQDLRPYLESLRAHGPSPTRAWIPWRQWLAKTSPISTQSSIDGDRRKARLAVLLKPEEIERTLAANVQRIRGQDGMIIVAGAAGEPECSGLVAEIAHICAANRSSVSIVLSRLPGESEDCVVALQQELERMVLMAGDSVQSDRHSPPVSATKLFDRIIVLESETLPKQTSVQAADLIWDLLAYREVADRFPVCRIQDGQVVCCRAASDGTALPMIDLWRFVRERALALAINGQWLSVQVRDGRLVPPVLDKDWVDRFVETFWTGSGIERPQNSLLPIARGILRQEGSSSLVGLQQLVPLDSLYHQQVAFRDRDMRVFNSYVEGWCHYVLASERAQGRWGLPAVLGALLSLTADFETVLQRIDRMSGNEGFAALARLSSAMYQDLAGVLTQLRREVEPWIGACTGSHVELDVVASGQRVPLCLDIEKQRQAAESAFDEISNAKIRKQVDSLFEDWYQEYGRKLLGQLDFRAPVSAPMHLQLHLGERVLNADDDLGSELRTVLDRYQSVVLSWPLYKALEMRQVSEGSNRFRIGKYSAAVYPGVPGAATEEDPFVAAALQISEMPLLDALGVASARVADPPFAWPEEANAARIAEKVRNSLQREPCPFSAAVVHLLRDTGKLYAFLADVADGRVTQLGSEYSLLRGSVQFRIGKAGEIFESIARQVVSIERSTDGNTIPSRLDFWDVSPEDAVARVGSNPVSRLLRDSGDWVMWQDVIRGLALEHGVRRPVA